MSTQVGLHTTHQVRHPHDTPGHAVLSSTYVCQVHQVDLQQAKHESGYVHLKAPAVILPLDLCQLDPQAILRSGSDTALDLQNIILIFKLRLKFANPGCEKTSKLGIGKSLPDT